MPTSNPTILLLTQGDTGSPLPEADVSLFVLLSDFEDGMVPASGAVVLPAPAPSVLGETTVEVGDTEDCVD